MESHGRGNIKLGLTIRRPSDADGYLTSAQDFWRGLRDLSANDSGATFSVGLLASQATEGTLKSYLSLKGVPTVKLCKLGHDLEALWELAYQLGFPLANPTPSWVKALATGHSGPDFFFRYPLGLHGISIPRATLLVSSIEAMIDHVYATARGP